MKGSKMKSVFLYFGVILLTAFMGNSLFSHSSATKKSINDPIEQKKGSEDRDVYMVSGNGKFEFGDKCQNLVYLTADEIIDLLQPENKENFKYFCTTDNVYHCYDYESLLYGYGRLETAPNGYMCTVIILVE